LPITTLGACGVGTENEIRARNVDHEAANLNSEVWMSRYSFCGVQLVSDLEFLESLASREADGACARVDDWRHLSGRR
jgi:hypothetical protein